MKYAEAEDIVKSYETLIETIPDGQFQGIKVAKILLLKIDELAHDLAVATEQNGLLREELFGKNKNKEDPDIEGVEDPPNAPEETREREQEARNNIDRHLLGACQMRHDDARGERRKGLIGILLRPVSPFGATLQLGQPLPRLGVVVTRCRRFGDTDPDERQEHRDGYAPQSDSHFSYSAIEQIGHGFPLV